MHATTSLNALKAISQERKERYPGGVAVRFLRSSVRCVDVGIQTRENKEVFSDLAGDLNTQIQFDLEAVRAFGRKDHEVVCLSNPPSTGVEFWHNLHGMWFPVRRWTGSTVVSYSTHAR